MNKSPERMEKNLEKVIVGRKKSKFGRRENKEKEGVCVRENREKVNSVEEKNKRRRDSVEEKIQSEVCNVVEKKGSKEK